MSIIPEMIPDERSEPAYLANYADVESLEFQLKLKSLYEYLDNCQLMLSDIRRDLSEYYEDPSSAAGLRRAAERLGKICMEADSWGFTAVYDVAQGIQTLLLNSGERSPGENFREALSRGLNLLYVLLQQCESDFQWKMVVANTIEYINQAGI